jgi:hypothetical protein
MVSDKFLTKCKPFQIKGLSLIMLKIWFGRGNELPLHSITQSTQGKNTGPRIHPKKTSQVLFAFQPRFGNCLSIYSVQTIFSEFANERVDWKSGIK